MTFDILFADRQTVRISGARSSGAARSLAQDQRFKRIGWPLMLSGSDMHAPTYDAARIIQVKQVKEASNV